MVTSQKIFLLDGMGLAYRAHFAFGSKPIYHSNGLNTTALFVFTNTLLDLLEKQKPTHLAVVFDTAAPTQRHEMYAAYKAQREEMPEDLSAALPHLRRLIEAFRIPLLECDGYEADDLIGTLAHRFEKEPATTYMVTQDKDFGQLVRPQCLIYKPSRSGDAVEIWGPQEVCEKWGIQQVDQVIDILGLMGDTSDNIPGVPGIGPKTAQKLIAQYGNLENLLEHLGDLKGKQRENLETYADQARLSKKLATIDCEVPLETKLEELVFCDRDDDAVWQLCREFEFTRIGQRLFGESFKTSRQPTPIASTALETQELLFEVAPSTPPMAPPPAFRTQKDVDHQYHTLTTQEERAELITAIHQKRSFCFDLETTSLDCRTCDILGIAIALQPHQASFVAFPEDPKQIKAILAEWAPVFADETLEKVGHNLKFDISVLLWHGIRVNGPLFDTMLAHALIQPDLRHGMDFLSENLLGYQPIPITALLGEKKAEQRTMREVPLSQLSEYACEDADVTFQLRQHLEPLLQTHGAQKVFYEIECPLVTVLADMERAGVKINPHSLRHFSVELEEEMTRLEQQIFKESGVEFNLNSPKQLGDILFQKMQIATRVKKTKTGQYSTNEQTLISLAPYHPIVRDILDYREVSKLKSTYVDALPSAILPQTGRIHTTYHQLVTATGRLNSTHPNLQNIPIRTPLGKKIRKAFIAPHSDWELFSADYSQIELRIAAALSEDEGMLDAFIKGIDIHQTTASKIYHVALEDVTEEMRRQAKMVNFGIIYGISAFGLAQRLGIPRNDASKLIESYFEQYPRVRESMDATIAFARQHGYVETLTGRRRSIRDIHSANATVRNAAERMAINTPLQGTAADMIKIAMVHIQKEFLEKKYQSKMILQVHDELVFDLAPKERDEIIPLVKTCMKKAIPHLKVPIVVDIACGSNWLEAT